MDDVRGALSFELVQYYVKLLYKTVCKWNLAQFDEHWPELTNYYNQGGKSNHLYSTLMRNNDDTIALLECLSDNNLRKVYEIITGGEEPLIYTDKSGTVDVEYDWKHLEWLVKVFFNLNPWETYAEFYKLWTALGKVPRKDVDDPKDIWGLYNAHKKRLIPFFVFLTPRGQRHFYEVVLSRNHRQ